MLYLSDLLLDYYYGKYDIKNENLRDYEVLQKNLISFEEHYQNGFKFFRRCKQVSTTERKLRQNPISCVINDFHRYIMPY